MVNKKEELQRLKRRLLLYYAREEEMLDGGVQKYGIGSRNLERYETDLKQIREAIQQLEQKEKELERALQGSGSRRTQGVVFMDW